VFARIIHIPTDRFVLTLWLAKMSVAYPQYTDFAVTPSSIKDALNDYLYYNGTGRETGEGITELHHERCRNDPTFCDTPTIETKPTIVILFEFRSHTPKVCKRTTGMRFAAPEMAHRELAIPVPVGHLHLHVLDMTGVKINQAGERDETHIHTALLVGTADGHFVIDARSSSAKVVNGTVYDTTQLATLLGVPQPNVLFTSLQNAAGLPICNGTTSIVALLLMHNWRGQVSLLSELVTSLNSIRTKGAKQLFLWLLWDAFTPPTEPVSMVCDEGVM
jgi:hypothetical protein